MLGGTGILISGLCFNESDIISCSIDNMKGEISFISETLLLCVSPSLTKIGALSFVLKLTRNLSVVSQRRFKTAEFTATFYSGDIHVQCAHAMLCVRITVYKRHFFLSCVYVG